MITAIFIATTVFCAWQWWKWRIMAEVISSLYDEKCGSLSEEEIENRTKEIIKKKLTLKGGGES